MKQKQEQRFFVDADKAHLRIDALVRAQYADITRRNLEEVFASGGVRVNGRRVVKGARVQAGDCVTVLVPGQDVAVPNAALALIIVAESEDWVIVDKPAGMHSIANSGEDSHTVANGLMARYPQMGGFGYHAREAGLVHRLDTNTSGLLLAAKRAPAFTELAQALTDGRVNKKYLALAVDVRHDVAFVRSTLRPDPKHRSRVVAMDVECAPDPFRASNVPDATRVTEYTVLERRGRLALLDVRVRSAYRHQIRAHLSAIGSPILGDALYRSSVSGQRHALHGSHLAYAGGASAAPFDVNSELPLDLRAWFALGDAVFPP